MITTKDDPLVKFYKKRNHKYLKAQITLDNNKNYFHGLGYVIIMDRPTYI